MRKYNIFLGNLIGRECGQAELAIVIEFYETHYSVWIRGAVREKDSRRVRVAESAYIEVIVIIEFGEDLGL